MELVHGSVLLVATLVVVGCGSSSPASVPAEPPPFDAAAAAAPFARELVEAVREDRPAALRDHDGRLALAYVLYKHAAVALAESPATRSAGEPMVAFGQGLAACALYHAFIDIPATECLDHAAEMEVPEDIARLTTEGAGEDAEPQTLGDVTEPLVAANEAREEEKRARLAALDPATCRLERLTSFGGEEDGATRAAIEETVRISLSASVWLRGVERFHYATYRCGDERLAILLSQYQRGAGRSGSSGVSDRRHLYYLSWQLGDPRADSVHTALVREGAIPGHP